MTRQTSKRWVSVCLLGAALGATGCSLDLARDPPAAGAERPRATAALPQQRLVPAAANGPAGLPSPHAPAAESGRAVITSIVPFPAAAANRSGPRESLRAATPRAPELVKTAGVTRAPGVTQTALVVKGPRPAPPRQMKPAGAEGLPVVLVAASGAGAPAAPPDLAGQGPAEPHRDVADGPAAPARKGYVDLTVQAWFGYADDHSWLNGQLIHSQATDTWRLHYASVDDPDPYGGTVTLTGSQQLEGLKDGEYVLVRGSPADPERREPGSPYQVDSLEVVERPN
jgi:hypothetical protein